MPGKYESSDRRRASSVSSLFVLFCLLFYAGLFFSLPVEAQAVRKIAVVKSRNLPQFNAALEGLKKGVSAAKIPHQIVEFDLSEGHEKVANRIRALSPHVIVPIGSTAAKFALDYLDNFPIVFAMVLYPTLSGITSTDPADGNVTGASMDIPIQKQFETLREILPRARKIGVLYDPDETGVLIEEGKKTAATLGMELVAISVRSSKDVPAALEGIERKADVLWSIADGTVFSSSMVQHIIGYTLQHNLPFMGLSPEFVEAGASFALTQDFEDIGRQAAESAVRVLAGASPRDLQITVPRRVLLVLNLRTANEIGVRIPENIIEKAAKVIR